MQIQTEERTIISNVEDEGVLFSLDNQSSILFNILRKQIYTYPIISTVREVLSNAVDAQRENGNTEKPIEINLPGEYLVIRDYGIGISPERLKDVISVYGKSTKRSDNTQIGGYGLGFKSPFSISDLWLAVTYWNGTEYTYQFYIDESGRGKIKLVNEQPCDISYTGTAIKIPIKYNEKQAIKDAVYHYCQFWTVPPKLIGLDYSIKFESPKEILSGDKWKVYEKPFKTANVLVDEIPYYIDLQYKCGISHIPQNVVFCFDIGEVELTATREEIRVTDSFKTQMKAIAEDYKQNIIRITQEELYIVDDVEQAFALINKVNTFGTNEWEWKGNKFKYPFNSHVYSGMVGLVNLTYDQNQKRKICRKHGNQALFSPSKQNYLFLEDDKTWDDLGPYDSRRLRHFIEEGAHTEVYVLDKQIRDFLPGLVYKKLADIKPTTKKGSGEKSPRKYVKALALNSYKQYHEEIESSQQIVYYIDKDFFKKNKYENLYHFPAKLVQIKESSIKYIEDQENWHTFDEYMDAHIYSQFTNDELSRIHQTKQYSNNYSSFSFLKEYVDIPAWETVEHKLTSVQNNLLEWLISNEKVKTMTTINLYKKYPLLEIINGYSVYSKQQEIIEYVQFINSKSQSLEGENTNV